MPIPNITMRAVKTPATRRTKGLRPAVIGRRRAAPGTAPPCAPCSPCDRPWPRRSLAGDAPSTSRSQSNPQECGGWRSPSPPRPRPGRAGRDGGRQQLARSGQVAGHHGASAGHRLQDADRHPVALRHRDDDVGLLVQGEHVLLIDVIDQAHHVADAGRCDARADLRQGLGIRIAGREDQGCLGFKTREGVNDHILSIDRPNRPRRKDNRPVAEAQMREAGGIPVGGMESNGVHAEVDELDAVAPDAVRQDRISHLLGNHRHQVRSAQRQAGPDTRPRRFVRGHEQIRSPRRDDKRMEPAEPGLPAVAGQVMAVQDVGSDAAKGDAQCSAPLQGAHEREPTAPEAGIPVHRDLAGEHQAARCPPRRSGCGRSGPARRRTRPSDACERCWDRPGTRA